MSLEESDGNKFLFYPLVPTSVSHVQFLPTNIFRSLVETELCLTRHSLPLELQGKVLKGLGTTRVPTIATNVARGP